MTTKQIFLGVIASLAFASTAAAAPLEGRWTCHEKVNRNGLKGTVDSIVDFGADGVLRMSLVMQAHKIVVPIRADAKYQARWQLVDGKLIEKADSATVTRFDVAGINKLDSDYATDFRSELMTPGTPPTVTFVTDDKIEIRQPNRITVCTR